MPSSGSRFDARGSGEGLRLIGMGTAEQPLSPTAGTAAWRRGGVPVNRCIEPAVKTGLVADGDRNDHRRAFFSSSATRSPISVPGDRKFFAQALRKPFTARCAASSFGINLASRFLPCAGDGRRRRQRGSSRRSVGQHLAERAIARGHSGHAEPALPGLVDADRKVGQNRLTPIRRMTSPRETTFEHDVFGHRDAGFWKILGELVRPRPSLTYGPAPRTPRQ